MREQGLDAQVLGVVADAQLVEQVVVEVDAVKELAAAVRAGARRAKVRLKGHQGGAQLIEACACRHLAEVVAEVLGQAFCDIPVPCLARAFGLLFMF